ncbi:MAG: hypothetical protein R3E68_12220 [Burkholderiaceae bacterium]
MATAASRWCWTRTCASVERVLPGSVMRGPTEPEMAEYRRPFAQAGEGRRPTLTWPRQILTDGEPADVVARVDAHRHWLETSPVPAVHQCRAGFHPHRRQRDYRRSRPAQTEVTVAGTHFIQEDSPDEIGTAIADFVRRLRTA